MNHDIQIPRKLVRHSLRAARREADLTPFLSTVEQASHREGDARSVAVKRASKQLLDIPSEWLYVARDQLREAARAWLNERPRSVDGSGDPDDAGSFTCQEP